MNWSLYLKRKQMAAITGSRKDSIRVTATSTSEDILETFKCKLQFSSFKISCLFIFFKIYVHKKRKIYNRKDCLPCNTNSNELMMGSHIIMNLIQANLLKSISQPHFRLQMGSQETMQVEWMKQTSFASGSTQRARKCTPESLRQLKCQVPQGG